MRMLSNDNNVLILFDTNRLIIIANARALLSHFRRAGRKYKGDEHIDSKLKTSTSY